MSRYIGGSLDRPGYVYAIAADEFIKIGVSKNPLKRLGEIQSDIVLYFEHEPRCSLVGQIPSECLRIDERLVHWIFRQEHSHYEWFTTSKEDILYVFSNWDRFRSLAISEITPTFKLGRAQ